MRDTLGWPHIRLYRTGRSSSLILRDVRAVGNRARARRLPARKDVLRRERHFLVCLRGDEEPLCTLTDGRLEVTLAAKRAIAEGRISTLVS